MKKIILIFALTLLISSVTALDLEITERNSGSILIADSQEKLTFELTITNLGSTDYMKFYNLQGFSMFPIGTTPINAGETKEIKLEISPIGKIRERGQYVFKYFIEGAGNSRIEEELRFEIYELNEILEIGSEKVDLDKNTIILYVQNKERKNLDNLTAVFKSKFFEVEKTFSLEPEEEKEFEIVLEGEDVSRLAAGFYTLDAEVKYKEAKTDLEGVIKFAERSDLKIEEENYGWLIDTQLIKKINNGNVESKTVISVQKSFLSSLFTTFSLEPDITEKKGFERYYIWEKTLKPGESLEVKVKTNYIFPILIAILIVFIAFYLKIYLTNDLVLKKKINFMHSKTGDLVLKVSILISAKRYIENVSVLDRLPALVKLHPKFGGEIPARADEKKRRIEWNFEKLEAGEKRIVSYIVYSKIGVLGKFALPPTTAIYEKEGKIKETESNKAYFMAEERKRNADD